MVLGLGPREDWNGAGRSRCGSRHLGLAVDDSGVQPAVPTEVEVLVTQIALPGLSHDVIGRIALCGRDHAKELKAASCIKQWLDQRLKNGGGAFERPQVRPGFEPVALRQMPRAQFCCFIHVAAVMDSEWDCRQLPGKIDVGWRCICGIRSEDE